MVRAVPYAVTATCRWRGHIYIETLTNALLQVNDVREIARVAYEHHALVIVDNTFVTPYQNNAFSAYMPICLSET